ncbi:50S ribosomal protein L25/general stress protein Ctc [Notoacmeibacter sp. MSK16QG-6]|uniref:50S ribosomal protein L25/general stress protein Ctc n=1 Tax=Notoacmeibacter sp. MSK16QG-6 TaxID=2957982 RepID=UPI00209E135F|nr:50S ribosomal protein L25/general stress protein Ctc [Notoacmeibacter sp. MSK16QG-6]MCP1199871.1 50S ribosomal protein L25/general stress protein Ctc [Notoacmeibacter sp. MSK16QG-6]
MSESYELAAERRERVGKGSARALRRENKIPAVIYGDKKDPLSIALPYKDVHLKATAPGFLTTIATINVDGEKIQVLPKDFQVDVVKDFTMHVDFLRVGKNTQVTVAIPVHFINEEQSPGLHPTETVDEDGEPIVPGVLNVVRHEVEVVCAATSIPDFIEVDLAGAEMGASLHISGVKLPEGVEPSITDRDFTIATIAAADALASQSEEEEEVVETEVIEQNAETVEGEESATEEEGTDKPDAE